MRDPRLVEQPPIAPDAGMAMQPGVGHPGNPYAREGRPMDVDGGHAGAVRAGAFDPTIEQPRSDHHRSDHALPGADSDAVGRIARDPRSRSWLLLATTILAALTFLLLLVHVLTDSDGGADVQPVIVEGVACLVGEGPEGSPEGQSVLYCQR